MADARRERIAVAMLAALQAGCAPMQIERNRRSAVSADEAPVIVLYDLGHQAELTNVGSISYTMRVEVDATVTGPDAQLGTLVNQAYVRILNSLPDYTLGDLCTGLIETGLEVRVAPVVESAKPMATFTVSFDVLFQTPDDDPTG